MVYLKSWYDIDLCNIRQMMLRQQQKILWGPQDFKLQDGWFPRRHCLVPECPHENNTCVSVEDTTGKKVSF